MAGDGRHDPPTSVAPTGRFRVYLGAAPGVGKTYSMVSEGHRRKERGADVVIGLVECHGRARLEEQLGDLEVVPRKVIDHRGGRFEEMDLDAVLARRPQVVLVDELAHTNVEGSGRHAKRWQDVVELLHADIDVVTTVNIQHLESIADAVERIIEAPVRERVPDWVLRKANQIELVDSSPEQLRRRLLHGNVYPAEQVDGALDHYFRTDNLTALRELALRFLADETEEQLTEFLRRTRTGSPWETSERILVGVTLGPDTDAVLHRAARMASRLKADLQVLHVKTTRQVRPFPDDRLVALRQMTADVGGEWNEVLGDDPAQALISFARRNHVTQIVVGSTGRSRIGELVGGGSIAQKLARLAAPAAIDVHVIARRNDPPVYSSVAEAADES